MIHAAKFAGVKVDNNMHKMIVNNSILVSACASIGWIVVWYGDDVLVVQEK
jgi:hypothetical protein